MHCPGTGAWLQQAEAGAHESRQESSTSARFARRLTAAETTPFWLARAFSTAEEQEEQVMPSTCSVRLLLSASCTTSPSNPASSMASNSTACTPAPSHLACCLECFPLKMLKLVLNDQVPSSYNLDAALSPMTTAAACARACAPHVTGPARIAE